MTNTTFLTISALISLLPATILPFSRPPARDAIFWLVLFVAISGPAVWIAASFGSAWRIGLGQSLWLTVAITLILFGTLSLAMRDLWRLAPLLFPYMLIIALLATLWLHPTGRPLVQLTPTVWVQFHIIISVITYGLLTIGAISGCAVIIQERALKRKRPGRLVRMLPSVVDGERIQVSLLSCGALVLGCGLLSGMAAEYFKSGYLIDLNHKTTLSLMTFTVIVTLLIVHAKTGIRGRRAARYFLAAYLLITLAYPGVKFVTDVILSRHG
ncbi:MAG: cytochrome c biogenesis protein CcsA [Pseudomonadota bacterium]|nr:cytochrome c biogenesis protein CcsA [Pseudomonadota bacterium]